MNQPAYIEVVKEVFEDFSNNSPVCVNWDNFHQAVDILYRKSEGRFPSDDSKSLGRVREIALTVGHSYIDEYHEYVMKNDEQQYISRLAEILRNSLESYLESAEECAPMFEHLGIMTSNGINRKFRRKIVHMLEIDDTKRGILNDGEYYCEALDHLVDEGVCILLERGINSTDDIFQLIAV